MYLKVVKYFQLQSKLFIQVDIYNSFNCGLNSYILNMSADPNN